MENKELRQELIRFCDSIRYYEHESGHSIYNDERESSDLVDIYLNSHSPAEFDTLQEGDWFQGTPEQYLQVLDMEMILNDNVRRVNQYVKHEGMVFDGYSFMPICIMRPVNKLSPEDFLRRADNTFKNQKQ